MELRFDVARSSALPEPVQQRLLAVPTAAHGRGVLVIQANRFRDRAKNRADARARLAEIVLAATRVPKRIATKPTRGSQNGASGEEDPHAAQARPRQG